MQARWGRCSTRTRTASSASVNARAPRCCPPPSRAHLCTAALGGGHFFFSAPGKVAPDLVHVSCFCEDGVWACILVRPLSCLSRNVLVGFPGLLPILRQCAQQAPPDRQCGAAAAGRRHRAAAADRAGGQGRRLRGRSPRRRRRGAAGPVTAAAPPRPRARLLPLQCRHQLIVVHGAAAGTVVTVPRPEHTITPDNGYMTRFDQR